VLARRLADRARALLEAGQAGPAAVLLRRALVHAPGDPEIQAMLQGIAAGDAG
jgi:hypothetical protein